MKTYSVNISNNKNLSIYQENKSFNNYADACVWADQILADVKVLSGADYLYSILQ